MKTIRIRVQNINDQDIIARQLIDDIPEFINPFKVLFEVIKDKFVYIVIIANHIGDWCGEVERSFMMPLVEVEKRIGNYIIIEDI